MYVCVCVWNKLTVYLTFHFVFILFYFNFFILYYFIVIIIIIIINLSFVIKWLVKCTVDLFHIYYSMKQNLHSKILWSAM